MRFMVMVKADKNTEAGVMPSEELLTAMGKFNEELVKAGIMLAGEGLHPSSKGARVRFSGDKRTVIDGPFAETKELVAGFWSVQVKSKEEAIEWVKRCPNPIERRVGDRDPPGVRGRGFRRGVHARAAGAGRADPRAGRRAWRGTKSDVDRAGSPTYGPAVEAHRTPRPGRLVSGHCHDEGRTGIADGGQGGAFASMQSTR